MGKRPASEYGTGRVRDRVRRVRPPPPSRTPTQPLPSASPLPPPALSRSLPARLDEVDLQGGSRGGSGRERIGREREGAGCGASAWWTAPEPAADRTRGPLPPTLQPTRASASLAQPPSCPAAGPGPTLPSPVFSAKSALVRWCTPWPLEASAQPARASRSRARSCMAAGSAGWRAEGRGERGGLSAGAAAAAAAEAPAVATGRRAWARAPPAGPGRAAELGAARRRPLASGPRRANHQAARGCPAAAPAHLGSQIGTASVRGRCAISPLNPGPGRPAGRQEAA